jgi:dynein heavy chain
MSETTPLPWDFEGVLKIVGSRGDPAPMRSVLLQEAERYNLLLQKVHHTLSDLQLGIKGLVVITSELEQVMQSIGNGMVPTVWGFWCVQRLTATLSKRVLHARLCLPFSPFSFSLSTATRV